MDRFWCGIVVLAAVLMSSATAAERHPTGQISEPAPVTAAAPLPPGETPSRSHGERQSSTEILNATASGRRLGQLSQNAFQRGLLPFSDYLEHLAAAEEVEVRLATMPTGMGEGRNSPQALRSALQPRIEALRVAVQQMEAFRQPAAAQWEADLLLGKYVLAQAEAEAAELLGEKSAADTATQAQWASARAHYARRVFDAQVLGHASLPQVAQAVTFLNVSPVWKRQVLQKTISQTRKWNASHAGIGRTDRVLDAELQLALWDTEAFVSTSDHAAVQRGLVEADRLTRHLFETQTKYYRHGTAALADLSRTWQTQRQIHLLSHWVDVKLPTDSGAAHARALGSLQRWSNAVTDRRGRVAADVEYVRLLTFMHAGDQRDPHSRRMEQVTHQD